MPEASYPYEVVVVVEPTVFFHEVSRSAWSYEYALVAAPANPVVVFDARLLLAS